MLLVKLFHFPLTVVQSIPRTYGQSASGHLLPSLSRQVNKHTLPANFLTSIPKLVSPVPIPLLSNSSSSPTPFSQVLNPSNNKSSRRRRITRIRQMRIRTPSATTDNITLMTDLQCLGGGDSAWCVGVVWVAEEDGFCFGSAWNPKRLEKERERGKGGGGANQQQSSP